MPGKWQVGFNSAFKGLMDELYINRQGNDTARLIQGRIKRFLPAFYVHISSSEMKYEILLPCYSDV